jgi:hypothetical protein
MRVTIKKYKGKSIKEKVNPLVKLKSGSNCIYIFLLSFLLLFTGVIFPQVKIREKISIKPDSVVKHDKVYNISPGQKSSATFRLELTYPPGVMAFFTAGIG